LKDPKTTQGGGRRPPTLRRTAESRTAFDWYTFCTPLEKPDMKPGGYGWSYASHDPRPAPLFFPGLRGRAAGGHPRSPRPSPVRGKTTQPSALPHVRNKCAFSSDRADNGGGMRMNNVPAPKGLAWFLRGAHRRISKNHDKGVLRNNIFMERARAAVGGNR
jgi:hypothetical protein